MSRTVAKSFKLDKEKFNIRKKEFTSLNDLKKTLKNTLKRYLANQEKNTQEIYHYRYFCVIEYIKFLDYLRDKINKKEEPDENSYIELYDPKQIRDDLRDFLDDILKSAKIGKNADIPRILKNIIDNGYILYTPVPYDDDIYTYTCAISLDNAKKVMAKKYTHDLSKTYDFYIELDTTEARNTLEILLDSFPSQIVDIRECSKDLRDIFHDVNRNYTKYNETTKKYIITAKVLEFPSLESDSCDIYTFLNNRRQENKKKAPLKKIMPRKLVDNE